MFAKFIASLILFFELSFILLVIVGIFSINVAVGISMQPFIETGAVLISMNPQYYEKYFSNNLTGKMIEYIAFGDMVWFNNITGEKIVIHFAVPTPIAHMCVKDKGSYLIVHGLNNNEWYEIVPRDDVTGVVLLALNIKMALALSIVIGLITATSIIYGFKRKIA